MSVMKRILMMMNDCGPGGGCRVGGRRLVGQGGVDLHDSVCLSTKPPFWGPPNRPFESLEYEPASEPLHMFVK